MLIDAAAFTTAIASDTYLFLCIAGFYRAQADDYSILGAAVGGFGGHRRRSCMLLSRMHLVCHMHLKARHEVVCASPYSTFSSQVPVYTVFYNRFANLDFSKKRDT